MRLYWFLSILLFISMICASACTSGSPKAATPTAEDQAGKTDTSPATVVMEKSTPSPVPADKEEDVTATPSPRPSPAKPPTEAEDAIELAMDDLTSRLNIDRDAIILVTVEATDWSDASLGCPAPDMVYAQVITAGFLVVFEADGEEYRYHTDEGRFVVLCGEDGAPAD